MGASEEWLGTRSISEREKYIREGEREKYIREAQYIPAYPTKNER